MGQNEKNWKFPQEGKISAISGYPKWLVLLLSERGINSEQQISSFLKPKYEELLSPVSFINVSEAVDRIIKAREKNEKVVIYGDYDVDGITSTALLFEALNKIGIQNIETYIPHREEEGYGLNQEAVVEIIKNKTDIIISVDCGITSKEIIDSAGIDFIVVDHHEIVPEKLPRKAIIIHPKMVKKNTEPQELSACGMAFFLAKALYEKYPKEIPKGQEKWLLDLAALATICDVVPLTGQNRILSHFGLLVLSKTKRVGLLELAKKAQTDLKDINAYTVGFILGPRINAAGRLAHAKKALQLLLMESQKEAEILASELNDLNLKRQKLCEKILDEAEAEIENSGEKDHEIFLISNKNWPRGVVGIIASRLADSYSRPVIVFEDDGKMHHGSARSTAGFDITAALAECEECLERFGGHAKAAGVTVKAEHFVVFKKKLLSIAKDKIKTEDLVPEIGIDTVIKEEEINDEMLAWIGKLEPFGFGNSTPVFAILSAEIENIKKVGSAGEHLKLNLKKSGLSAILFGNSYEIDPQKKYDLAFGLRYNYWNQRKSIELRIIDMRRSDD